MIKRGVFLLLAVVMLAVGTASAVWWARSPAAPAAWVQTQYALDREQTAKVAQLENDYQSRCTEMCRKISEADETLDRLMKTSARVTPEIGAAIARSDAVRAECRTSMLAHFYEVAAVLPASQRADYLQMVLPAVRNPEGMGVRVTRP